VRSAADVNQQQSAFAEVLSKLMAVHEAYPDLKASALFKETMTQVKNFEENVRMSRMIYNDSATRMNRYVRQWPSSFVASYLHFGLKDYLKIDDEKKRDMPGVFS
jgi:LemA protein